MDINPNDRYMFKSVVRESELEMIRKSSERFYEENKELKNKISKTNEQIKNLMEKVRLWKNGLFCTTEKSALFHVEKTLKKIEEILKND